MLIKKRILPQLSDAREAAVITNMFRLRNSFPLQKLSFWLCGSCVLVLSATVQADSSQISTSDWYGGFSLGESRLSLNTSFLEEQMQVQGLPLNSLSRNTNDTGYKLFAGALVNDYLAVEGGFFRLGEVDFNARTAAAPGGTAYPLSGHLRDQGANLDLVARLLLGNAFTLLGRVGLTYNDTDGQLDYQRPINLDSYNHNKDYLNHKYGVGLQYQLSPSWAMRFELERYRLDDIWGDQGDLNLVSLGMVYQYGQATAYVAPTTAPPTEAKLEPYMAPAETAEAQINPAPVVLELADVHFEFDQSTLTPIAKSMLAKHVVALKNQPQAQIQIAGYTSASGSEAYNQQLSERRAKAVEQYLIGEGGIAVNRLTTIGYGETSPAQIEDNPSDLRSVAALANMRVLFKMVVK